MFLSYGGSIKIRSKTDSCVRRIFKFFNMFHLIVRVLFSSEQLFIFFFKVSKAAGLSSANTTDSAPRLNASIPMAPVPANKSRIVAFRTRSSRILKIDSRTRSAVGLVRIPGTVRSFFPFSSPPIILIVKASILV